MTASADSVIRDAICGDTTFVRATFSGPGEGLAPWRRVIVRPVQLARGRRLQFSYFDDAKDTTKNLEPPEARGAVDVLLQHGYRNVHLLMQREQVTIRVREDGRRHIRRTPLSLPVDADLAHDRKKDPVLGDRSRAFLQRMDILDSRGAVRPGLARKYRQVNEFITLLAHTGDMQGVEGRPVTIADLGCGSATLTFALYHYLHDVQGLPVRVIGVDVKDELIDRHRALADAIGCTDIVFHHCPISEVEPEHAPDIVLALHACDTATDDALARAIGWGSRLILSVPCCHHHLHAQRRGRSAPSPLEPVFRHGILAERYLDVLTDALRASILRIMDYRADIIEFTSVEHTSRNLMLRAVATAGMARGQVAEEYRRLTQFWQVTPYLESALGDAFLSRLGR